jgi:hypothetical protein
MLPANPQGSHGTDQPLKRHRPPAPIISDHSPPARPSRGTLRARRAYAFDRGEALARQRAISADAYLFLYKELVCLCGDDASCWPGIAWLARRLDVSTGTIKRWMEELVGAGLVQRQCRSGGRTSLTTITALLEFEASPDTSMVDAPSVELRQRRPLDVHDGMVHRDVNEGAQIQRVGQNDVDLASAAASTTTVEIEADPHRGSNPICRSFKKLKPNERGGCGVTPSDTRSTDVATRRRLQAEGVVDVSVLDELRAFAPAEVNAVIRYVARCRSKADPRRPGLIVHLLRQQVGHVGTERADLKGEVHAAAPALPIAMPKGGAASGDPADAHSWRRVLDRLQRELPESDFQTWIAPLKLLLCAEGIAVIETPNVFVRDELERCWLGRIALTLDEICGQAIEPRLIIGAPPVLSRCR